MIPEVENWIIKNRPDITKVHELMMDNLPDEPESLIDALSEIEAWSARIGYLLAQANSLLTAVAYSQKPDKVEGQTEFDRKIALDNELKEVRGVRDRIESLADSIKMRITLGQSILAYRRQFLEGNRVLQERR